MGQVNETSVCDGLLKSASDSDPPEGATQGPAASVAWEPGTLKE